MARIKLNLPKQFAFTAEIPVRITDLNYGGHVGNDAILSIMHEARLQFLTHFAYTEKDIEGRGVIMSDAVIIYKSQSFYGDVLEVGIALGEFNDYGCDVFYRIINRETGKEIARAKTGIVFFDYDRQKLSKTPERFREMFDV